MTDFNRWLTGPYEHPEWTDDADDAYGLYVDAHEQELRRDFESGGHDCETFDEYAANEPPITFREFADKWHTEQEDMARELRWSRRSSL